MICSSVNRLGFMSIPSQVMDSTHSWRRSRGSAQRLLISWTINKNKKPRRCLFVGHVALQRLRIYPQDKALGTFVGSRHFLSQITHVDRGWSMTLNLMPLAIL